MNESINKSINQSINQSINRSINQSMVTVSWSTRSLNAVKSLSCSFLNRSSSSSHCSDTCSIICIILCGHPTVVHLHQTTHRQPANAQCSFCVAASTYGDDLQVAGSSPGWAPLRSGLGQATYTCVPLSSSIIIWYRPRG